MKILAGLLILAISLQPFLASANSEAAAAAAAAAAAENNRASATAVAVASARSSAHISCSCPLIYDPVCGTDGRTYSNDCVLKCVSDHNVAHHRHLIYVHRRGECPHIPCTCTKVYKPVCGSDGETYGNLCFFDWENKRRDVLCLPHIKISHVGVCKHPICACSSVIIPVCGTDNRTYRNICFLECASRIDKCKGGPGIGLQYCGPCLKESCVCPAVVDPVCGTDDNTYDNSCILQCQNRRRSQLGEHPIYVQYKGACVDCNCTAIYCPVCASNKVTFANRCTLNCENIRRAKNDLPPLIVKSEGVCPCPCPLIYAPVCASDRRTYGNRCLLDCENKRRKDLGLRQIKEEHEGRCICNCDCCSRIHRPVCGNDGRTYWNRCYLDCNKSCRGDIGRPLYPVHKGPC